HRELRPAGRRHLPGVLRPAKRPGHGPEPARRPRPGQRSAGLVRGRAGRRPDLRRGGLPVSAGTAPAGTRAEELAWLAGVLWGPTPEVELVVGEPPAAGP